MTLPTPPETEKPHRNHGLFSDHYLEATLPERPGWKEMKTEAHLVMEAVARIFDSYVPSASPCRSPAT